MCKEVDESAPEEVPVIEPTVQPEESSDDEIFREWPYPDAPPPPPAAACYKVPKVTHVLGDQSSNDELSSGSAAVKQYFPDGQDSSVDEQVDALPLQ